MKRRPCVDSTDVVSMALSRAQLTFFCCSPWYRFATLFGAKHLCRAQATATIPVTSHALDDNIAISMARNRFSQGAFYNTSQQKQPTFGLRHTVSRSTADSRNLLWTEVLAIIP